MLNRFFPTSNDSDDRTPAKLKRVILAILGAAIPAVLWSLPVNPSMAMLLSLVCFFIATRGCSVSWGWRLGFLYGVVLFGVSLSWLWQIFSAMSIVLWLILALFPGLMGALTAWSQRHVTRLLLLLPGIAVFWTAIEYYRSEWFMVRFPWITPGTAFGPLWLHSVFGVYGVSFTAVLLALIIVYARRSLAKGLLSAGFLCLLLVRPPAPMAVSEKMKIPVLVIQRENCDFFSYLDDTRASDFCDGIILWPEYSTCSDIRDTIIYLPEKLSGVEILRRIAMERNVTFIVGAISPSGKDNPWNEAVFIDGKGEVGSHRKNRPVHFMMDGIAGTTQNPVMTRWGNIGSPICFDNDYTEVPRKFVGNGAEVFLAPCLDAQRWTRRQHLQHGELFRLRAVETGRWYIVCATSGLSQTVRPDGVRVQELPVMEDMVMETHAYRSNQITPYVRWGWTFPWVCCCLGLVFLVHIGMVAMKKRKSVRSLA